MVSIEQASAQHNAIGLPEREGPASFRRQLEAVKQGSRIEQVAQDYGEFKLAGSGRLLGRCLSPDHEDRSPSMSVFPEKQRFRCFGCGEHGDVLDLVMLAEGCELWEAMIVLSQSYGIELPPRPQAWFAKQERQKATRRAIEGAKVRRVQRRIYRWLLAPPLANLTDEDERLAEATHAWEDAAQIARLLVARASEEVG
jgi:CHC2 zinc finger